MGSDCRTILFQMSTAGAVGLCSAPVALLGYLGAKCAPFSQLAVTAILVPVWPLGGCDATIRSVRGRPGRVDFDYLIVITWGQCPSTGFWGRAAPLPPGGAPAARGGSRQPVAALGLVWLAGFAGDWPALFWNFY